MTQAAIFLNELTVVDHAYIDDRGMVVGGSFNPSFVVSGEVSDDEQVVVDFSTIKKDIKALIDDKEAGFDHKLWISSLHSNVDMIDYYGIDRAMISTPYMDVDIPLNACKFFDFLEYDTMEIGHHMAVYLTDKLREKYPTVIVECVNTTNPHLIRWVTKDDSVITDPLPIRYYHGLINSSSYGCANLFHGHLSFIQFEVSKSTNPEDVATFMAKIHSEWSDMMYVWDKNLDENIVSYDHPVRGFFAVEFTDSIKHRVFNTETTIENLVQHLKEEYFDEFVALGITKIYFSEGLSKGAVTAV